MCAHFIERNLIPVSFWHCLRKECMGHEVITLEP